MGVGNEGYKEQWSRLLPTLKCEVPKKTRHFPEVGGTGGEYADAYGEQAVVSVKPAEDVLISAWSTEDVLESVHRWPCILY